MIHKVGKCECGKYHKTVTYIMDNETIDIEKDDK